MYLKFDKKKLTKEAGLEQLAVLGRQCHNKQKQDLEHSHTSKKECLFCIE